MTTRLSGAAELVLGRLLDRRKALAVHCLRALEMAAEILAAMHEAAWGHVPSMRADRQVRYREMQFTGEGALPLEDWVAIALESDEGRVVAVVGVRMLAAFLGYSLTPLRPAGVAIGDAAAAKAEADAPVCAAIHRAMKNDGRVDGDEAARIRPLIQLSKRRTEELEAALAEIELAEARTVGTL